MGIKCIQPIVGNVFPPHLTTCSIVAFETACWGGNTTLVAHPKIILPRVSLSQLIFVPSHTRFCGPLFRRPRVDSESSSSRCRHCHCRCSPLATTTTTVAPWLHPCRRCRLVIVTAVTTVSPPLFCDLFDCCVCSVVVSSPLPHLVVAIPPTASVIIVVVVVAVVVVAYYPPLRVICLIVVCMSIVVSLCSLLVRSLLLPNRDESESLMAMSMRVLERKGRGRSIGGGGGHGWRRPG